MNHRDFAQARAPNLSNISVGGNRDSNRSVAYASSVHSKTIDVLNKDPPPAYKPGTNIRVQIFVYICASRSSRLRVK